MDYRKKIKKLEGKLDELWSTYIRTRDFWSCMRCHQSFRHEPGKLQGAHIIRKSASKYLRWHKNNGVALCYSCHIGWQHLGGNEVEFVRLAERVLGRKAIDELLKLKKSNPTTRFGLKDLEVKISELKALQESLDV